MVTDVIRIIDSIRSKVLESTLAVAGHFDRIGRREGKPRVAIFILGESHNVPIWSGQPAPNPLHAYEDRLHRITNPDTHNTFNEFSKLDGAFAIRGDGFIRSAGMFIGSS